MLHLVLTRSHMLCRATDWTNVCSVVSQLAWWRSPGHDSFNLWNICSNIPGPMSLNEDQRTSSWDEVCCPPWGTCCTGWWPLRDHPAAWATPFSLAVAGAGLPSGSHYSSWHTPTFLSRSLCPSPSFLLWTNTTEQDFPQQQEEHSMPTTTSPSHAVSAPVRRKQESGYTIG